MNTLPQINPAQETEKITKLIQDSLKQAGMKKAMVAVSGGIDSATTLTLAVKALGSDNVYALIMPSLQTSNKNTDDSIALAETLDIPEDNIMEISLAAAQEAVAKTLQLFTPISSKHADTRIGNIAARLRMIFLYDQAKASGALVVGTENKSEHLLGYFTRYGDEASDIEPLKHLYKTQVYDLAEFLMVPNTFIAKSPSADLWKGQSDEAELGFSYKIADPILYHHFDKNQTEKDLKTQGFESEQIKLVLNQTQKTNFKHQVPYTL